MQDLWRLEEGQAYILKQLKSRKPDHYHSGFAAYELFDFLFAALKHSCLLLKAINSP